MSMSVLQLIKPAPDWTDETWTQRMDAAASLLFLHGYITQGQRTKITHKIETQFKAAIEAGIIVPRKEPT